MSLWDGVDEFAAVASRGSFSKAAKALGLSTTHMSRAVVALELRLQAQLLHRTTRTVRLTDTGRAFLDHIERLIAERDEAIALVSRDGEPTGDLRITCSTAMGERFIAPITRLFAQRYPQLSVSIDLTNRIVDLVGEGYDLAIRTGRLVDSGLIGTRIASRTLFTCASPDYLARHGTPTTVAELARHDCLVGNATTWPFRNERGGRSFRPKGRWRCNSGTAVLQAAEEGMGICQLPDFYVLRSIAEGRLVTILDEVRPPSEPIWVVYPERRHLSPKIREFVAILRERLPDMLAGT